MKIESIYKTFDSGCRAALTIHIDGTKKLSFWEGEPEDNNLGRNFNDCYSIVSFMKMAYEAGKNGETLEISKKEIEDEDE